MRRLKTNAQGFLQAARRRDEGKGHRHRRPRLLVTLPGGASIEGQAATKEKWVGRLLTKLFIVKSLLNTPPTPNIVVYPIVMYVSCILYDCTLAKRKGHTENHFLRLLQNFKKF